MTDDDLSDERIREAYRQAIARADNRLFDVSRPSGVPPLEGIRVTAEWLREALKAGLRRLGFEDPEDPKQGAQPTSREPDGP